MTHDQEIEILRQEITRLQELLKFQQQANGSKSVRVEVQVKNGDTILVFGTDPGGNENALIQKIIEGINTKLYSKPKPDHVVGLNVNQTITHADLTNWMAPCSSCKGKKVVIIENREVPCGLCQKS